jgi:hypothetical protein
MIDSNRGSGKQTDWAHASGEIHIAKEMIMETAITYRMIIRSVIAFRGSICPKYIMASLDQ